MVTAKYVPIYDIHKSYDDNVKNGPNKDYKATITAPNPQGDYQILGFKVNSPFGSASCPTGIDSQYIKTMFDNGYDIVTTKTRRSVHFAPNQMSNVVHVVAGKISVDHNFEELPSRTQTEFSDYNQLTIVNSFGNNSIDPEYWIPDAKIANQNVPKGGLLITSIVGTIQPGFSEMDYYKDFAHTAELAVKSGAKAIEINLSCPNVATEGVVCYNKEAVVAICKLVKEAVGKTPVIAKFGYFSHLQNELLVDIVGSIDQYVSVVSSINTLASPVLDDFGKQLLPGEGRLKAGLSGHAIKDVGLDMTMQLNRIRKTQKLNYEIISFGGVLTPQDFWDYRKAGADAVLSASGAMWNPNLAYEIKQSINKNPQ